MARIIEVTAGDTLAQIAATYYGSADLALKIATYNGFADPDLLLVGERLELPLRKELDGPEYRVPERPHSPSKLTILTMFPSGSFLGVGGVGRGWVGG